MSSPSPRLYFAVILFFLVANVAPFVLRAWVLSNLEIQVTALLDENGRPLNRVERHAMGLAEQWARRFSDFLDLEIRESSQKELLVEISAENRSGVDFYMVQAEYVLEMGNRKVASGLLKPKEPKDMFSSQKTAFYLPLHFDLPLEEVRALAKKHPEVFIKGWIFLGRGSHTIKSPFSLAFALEDLDF